VKDVSDMHGRKLLLIVKAWATVKDVKDQLFGQLAIPPCAQRLYLGGPLQTYSRELPNHRTLHDAGIYKSGELLLLDIREGYGYTSTSLTESVVTHSPAGPMSATACTTLESHSVTNTGLYYTCDIRVTSSMLESTPKPLQQIVQMCRRGFARGFKPELVLDGSGGTYFLRDPCKVRIGVFKPADEEPYADNNPRGYVNTNTSFIKASPVRLVIDGDGADGLISLRAGISPGESCLREVAAFLLDHDGFSGVPMTTLVGARHPAFHISGTRLKVYEGGASIGSHSLITSPPFGGLSGEDRTPRSPLCRTKIGSFQKFVNAECSMDDLSPSKISVEEVHKIAVLDIRTMNADRNSANLLCRRKMDNTFEMVPIDHGYCLRSVCDVSWFDWCWLDWPQLKQVSNRLLGKC